MLHENTIGSRIQELREDHDLIQEDFARAVNVSRGKLSQWECNARLPSVLDIEEIADAFGTTTDWLIRGIQPENTRIHAVTGLSDEAIQTLKAFKDSDPEGMKTAALSQALSSVSFLNVLSSLLMVQSDERGYYEATCSPVDGFYTVEMSPDSFAASLGIRLLHTLEAIRTGNKAPLQPYPPDEQRIVAVTEKLRSKGKLIDEQEEKGGATNEQASKR